MPVFDTPLAFSREWKTRRKRCWYFLTLSLVDIEGVEDGQQHNKFSQFIAGSEMLKILAEICPSAANICSSPPSVDVYDGAWWCARQGVCLDDCSVRDNDESCCHQLSND